MSLDKEVKTKLYAVLLSVVLGPVCSFAYQVGDVLNEYDEDVWTTSDRITVDDVEYLYTFKGVRHCKEVVTQVTEDGGWYSNTEVQKSELESWFVIESAIPLTGNYDVTIPVDTILGAFAPDNYTIGKWESDGYHSYTYYYRDASLFVIGDSCFEDNELLERLTISCWTNRKVKIGKRAFFDATNLKMVTSINDNEESFNALQLVEIDDAAFENCENLGAICVNCDELTRIGEDAFCDCAKFYGIVSDCNESHSVAYISGDSCCLFESSNYSWKTPKLASIGARAFYNAGGGISRGFYDWRSLSWIIGNKEIEIGESAFYNCQFFKEITLPSDMTKIQASSFDHLHCDSGPNGNGMGSSTKINLPSALETIGDHAFVYALVTINTWPASLKTIGAGAFYGNMSYIDVEDENGGKTYSIRNPWSLCLPDGLGSIGDGAFSGGLYMYQYSRSAYHYDGCGPIKGSVELPASITKIPAGCFANNAFLEEVKIHSGITEIGDEAFQGCARLCLTIPSTVAKVGKNVAADYSVGYFGIGTASVSGPLKIIFEGRPPEGVAQSGLMKRSVVFVPAEFATEWAPYMNENVKLAKKVDGVWTALGGSVVSAKIRDGVPNVMDITYKVTSIKPTVKVRLVAYKDGSKSFANATVPVTFIADKDGNATTGNIGDAVEPNVEHTVSWQVSSDWGDVKLAKISVEVFVLDDELLPLQLMSLPANETRGKLTFSHNTQSSEKVSNALYWLLASKESDLKLDSGKLTRTDTNAELANGTSINTSNALAYLYGKMGYGVLTGDNLSEVNSTVRLSLGDKTYAAKVETK